MRYSLSTPLKEEDILKLRSGDEVLLSGMVYGARDAAHLRILEHIKDGSPLPFDVSNSVIFYVGPSPTPPGKTSGSIGPTTSARMDPFTEPLLAKGAKAFIGKGCRSKKIKELLQKYQALYLVAIGGIAALTAEKVLSIEPVAYSDLGPEAIYRLCIKDMPLFVAYDVYGGDIFAEALLKE
jgi:fumarate hydratase subunit beta